MRDTVSCRRVPYRESGGRRDRARPDRRGGAGALEAFDGVRRMTLPMEDSPRAVARRSRPLPRGAARPGVAAPIFKETTLRAGGQDLALSASRPR
jgi:hypothetical protein